MRMGSHIAAAECVLDEGKFPVILPKNYYVTHLVIKWYSSKYGHINNETVMNEIRFHVSELRTAVNKVARGCNWWIFLLCMHRKKIQVTRPTNAMGKRAL